MMGELEQEVFKAFEKDHMVQCKMKPSTQNNDSSVRFLITSRKQDIVLSYSFMTSLWTTLNQQSHKHPSVTGHLLWVTAVLQALSVAMLVNVSGRLNYIKWHFYLFTRLLKVTTNMWGIHFISVCHYI